MDYRVTASVVDYDAELVIICFELDFAPGVEATGTFNLSYNLARLLSVVAACMVEYRGKPYIGLELPNKLYHTVYLREVFICAKCSIARYSVIICHRWR